jgi:hypothetical protein
VNGFGIGAQIKMQHSMDSLRLRDRSDGYDGNMSYTTLDIPGQGKNSMKTDSMEVMGICIEQHTKAPKGDERTR